MGPFSKTIYRISRCFKHKFMIYVQIYRGSKVRLLYYINDNLLCTSLVNLYDYGKLKITPSVDGSSKSSSPTLASAWTHRQKTKNKEYAISRKYHYNRLSSDRSFRSYRRSW